MTENGQEPNTHAHDPPVGPSDCERELAACRQESEERLQALLRARADLDN